MTQPQDSGTSMSPIREQTSKPWSQVEDDLAEVRAAPASDRQKDATTPEDPGQSAFAGPAKGLDNETPSVQSLRQGPEAHAVLRGVSTHWALAPMAAALLWLAYAMLFPPAPGAAAWSLHLLGIGGLIVAAGIILILATGARQRALRRLVTVIQAGSKQTSGRLNLDETNELWSGLVTPEFRPVLQGIESHAANVEKQVRTLLFTQQQLSLELSMARGQEERAAAVIEAIGDPILSLDAFDRLILSNAAAQELFDFSASEALRQPIDRIISDERLLRLAAQVREADLRAAQRHAEHEYGGKIYASTLAPLVLKSGQENDDGRHGVVILLRDVTKQHEAAKKKSEFVSQVAHELRTPLSSICSYVEMLVDGEAADDATRQEFYEIIQTSADRLGRLIDNMLNISRIEAGTVRINKEPISVAIVTKEAVDMMRPQAEARGISLTQHLTPVAYRVLADRDLIYQAILNLIGNAVKYTPQDGKVSVRMTPHEENKTILIEVSDTGVGIPKEDIPKMFKKFFRVEANKKMAKGTGLGLNLVKNVVEKVHTGTVTLTSEVGKGSTFGIVLPLM